MLWRLFSRKGENTNVAWSGLFCAGHLEILKGREGHEFVKKIKWNLDAMLCAQFACTSCYQPTYRSETFMRPHLHRSNRFQSEMKRERANKKMKANDFGSHHFWHILHTWWHVKKNLSPKHISTINNTTEWRKTTTNLGCIIEFPL